MRSQVENPLQKVLSRQSVAILDGGLATELEARGVSLDTDLWSAALLVDGVEAIRAVHRDYLEAGADFIVSATYQATLEGLATAGLRGSEAEAAIRGAVTAAIEERDDFCELPRHGVRVRPSVAAGVGPYGAYLADGSEFTGAYDLNEGELFRFHESRWRILANSGADLLACETVPSVVEARVLARLLSETPGIGGWISFSCRDGESISDGTRLAEVVREVSGTPGLLAIGINCTSPRYLSSLLRCARAETDLPLIVYPNSGESWDSESRCWVESGERFDLAQVAPEWVTCGARVIGGCCRTTPDDVRRLRLALLGDGAPERVPGD